FTLSPYFNFSSLAWYFSLFSYTLGHVSFAHLFGNLSIMLLIGPILEEKYGSKTLLLMMAATALFTALLNNLFFSTGLIGASGIVFMMIILVSFANSKGNEIPLTFILVLLLYLGKEVFMAFESDSISQFAHIIGGLAGAIFGFSPIIKKRTPNLL
ncbi:MAG: rhomboid family intramembrane serine protease, partial [Bacteroidales bacterium]|nr:rhomboid family intramembrane serine protease [Bacteroidales bacterium]